MHCKGCGGGTPDAVMIVSKVTFLQGATVQSNPPILNPFGASKIKICSNLIPSNTGVVMFGVRGGIGHPLHGGYVPPFG